MYEASSPLRPALRGLWPHLVPESYCTKASGGLGMSVMTTGIGAYSIKLGNTEKKIQAGEQTTFTSQESTCTRKFSSNFLEKFSMN